MAIETLANLEVYDASTWKYPSGSTKGVSVYDSSSWNVCKEIYVYDSGAWHYVHPIRVVNPTTLSVTELQGGCDPDVNAKARLTMRMEGPLPQVIAGTGSFYYWRYYRKVSSISEAHLLGLSFLFSGTSLGISSANMTTAYMGHSWIGGGSTVDRWAQYQARIIHSVLGEMGAAAGGISTSLVQYGKTQTCDGGPE